ncbi:MAG TPA: ATP-dependent DNA helicase RecG [Acidimicrobiales bacterium]
MPEPLTLADFADLGVDTLKGVGPVKLKALADLEITSLLDLLTHYPRRHLDRTRQSTIGDLEEGDEATLLVTVDRVNLRRLGGRRTILEVRVSDGTGSVSVPFFNQPWREKQLRPGQEIILFGRLETFRGKRQVTNAFVDFAGDQTGQIVAVYPQSEKSRLYSTDYRTWIAEILRRSERRGIADPVPPALRTEHGFVDRERAVKGFHRPESMDDVNQARRRLVFDELFRVQVALVRRKLELERTTPGIVHDLGGRLVRAFHEALPYPLTAAQERVISEIEVDLGRTFPMHRLLQGDVGSGKTVVAVSALLVAVQGGLQGALMAPTEVLAEQHHLGLRELLADLTVPDDATLMGERPLRLELLTNRTTGADRTRVLDGLKDGTVDLVVGTHALIQDRVGFKALGVVVIDEQHRFGVEQRAALRDAGEGDGVPDVLVMTATPIPRTAAMTVYGDLDVSVLDELPPGRTPVETEWVRTEEGALELGKPELWEKVRSEVAAGRQAYVVCPLIEESDKLQVASAEQTWEALRAGDLAGLEVGLLHGRVSPAEKERTMELFRSGALQVLVATTVIEVGVDVPNATVMVVLDADRFGIAQLHQLRGRVGRGADQAYCFLVGQGLTPDGESRLEAMVRTTDGFELAEVDLDLRGEGTLFGERQKGRNDLKLASLRRDKEWVVKARRAALDLVTADPELSAHPLLRDEIDLLHQEDDAEFLLKN